jgi:hypothetical protein
LPITNGCGPAHVHAAHRVAGLPREGVSRKCDSIATVRVCFHPHAAAHDRDARRPVVCHPAIESPGRDLAHNPRAALLYWRGGRQIRVVGDVEPGSRARPNRLPEAASECPQKGLRCGQQSQTASARMPKYESVGARLASASTPIPSACSRRMAGLPGAAGGVRVPARPLQAGPCDCAIDRRRLRPCATSGRSASAESSDDSRVVIACSVTRRRPPQNFLYTPRRAPPWCWSLAVALALPRVRA